LYCYSEKDRAQIGASDRHIVQLDSVKPRVKPGKSPRVELIIFYRMTVGKLQNPFQFKFYKRYIGIKLRRDISLHISQTPVKFGECPIDNTPVNLKI
jgi:hypothetical protein